MKNRVKRIITITAIATSVAACTPMSEYSYAMNGNPTINQPTTFPTVDASENYTKEEMNNQNTVVTKITDKTIFYNSIWFDTGDAKLKDNNDVNLILLSNLKYLTMHKDAKIVINGYASELGTSQKNKVLSTQRANNVKKYLVSHGINKNNIVVFGYGDKQNKFSDTSVKSKNNPANRRIDILYTNDKPNSTMKYIVDEKGMPVIVVTKKEQSSLVINSDNKDSEALNNNQESDIPLDDMVSQE